VSSVVKKNPIVIDVKPMIHEIVRDIETGVPASVISGRFHVTIAEIVSKICRAARDETKLKYIKPAIYRKD
jgi:hydrogenase maturation protein HypF